MNKIRKGFTSFIPNGVEGSVSRGFTLIELLVVIAIIAILASTVIISLSSSRNKAYDSAALTTMRSVQAEALSCVLGSGASGSPENIISPVVGGLICPAPATQKYPNLAKGQWIYMTTPGTDFASNGMLGTFQFRAKALRDTASSPTLVVTCTENGCAQGETVN